MAQSNFNHHIYGWIEKIETNVAKFREKEDVSPDDKIEFITHQYHLMMLIHRALNGQVIFTGARSVDVQIN